METIMRIPYSYFEDEVKDGFYVDSIMKCCWAAQEEILSVIDKICKKYDIQYFAEWGTMLGTVRHGGYIPWDDDMDITMKRPDYNKFLRVAEKEMPEGWHLLNYQNDDDYWDVMTRVLNSNQIRFDQDFLTKYHNFPFVAGVDIFPMDFFPPNSKEAETLKSLVNEVKITADACIQNQLEGKQLEEQLNKLEILCNQKIDRSGNVPRELYDIVVSLYALYGDEETKEVALMPLWADGGSQIYPKEYYAESIRMPFDQMTIPVPIAYDAILKKKYGDYMKMVRKGGSHDYPYYKKQVVTMAEAGKYLPEFHYEDRTLRKGIKTWERIDSDKLQFFEKIHVALLKLLLIHEYENVDTLLTQCQEYAITFGEQVENIMVDNESTVSLLEEYCELVFQLHQLIEQREEIDAEGVYILFQEQIQNIRIELEKEHHWKKKIVFLIDKASRWGSLEKFWNTAKEDAECVVSVIAIPYIYRRMDGTIIETHYERELLPDVIEAMDCEQCDLEKYHPDVIFINSPYDSYNYFTTIHPDFYSSKLVEYTEKLIYVPWFSITELTREDERGWQSMQHFVTMPGVVNADKVYVQSEQMKETYIDYLTDWAGEETREEWRQKIACIEPKYVSVENSTEVSLNKLPDTWRKKLFKKDGSRKKIVLYTVSGTGFIEYGMQAAEKLRYVLRTFKDNRENIVLIWYPDKSIEEALRFTHLELWKEYEAIVQNYQQEDWGIYAEEIDEQTAVNICDAYYGDPCKLSQAVVVAKKPVMLQNITITN